MHKFPSSHLHYTHDQACHSYQVHLVDQLGQEGLVSQGLQGYQELQAFLKPLLVLFHQLLLFLLEAQEAPWDQMLPETLACCLHPSKVAQQFCSRQVVLEDLVDQVGQVCLTFQADQVGQSFQAFQ